MAVFKVGGLYIGIAAEFMSEPVWQVGRGGNWRDQVRPMLPPRPSRAHVPSLSQTAEVCVRQAFTRLGLYTSRDGVRWNRSCGDGGWVSGGEPGSADYGMMCFCAGGEPLVTTARW